MSDLTWRIRLMMSLALCATLVTMETAMANLVVDPHVATDRSVDTSSPEAMVRSLTRADMGDQEKALAIYNFVRRTMFHYRYNTRAAGGGTMDLINGVGYALCTPTAGTQARLSTLAGLEGHVLSMPGHGSVIIKYGGKWRWVEAFVGGCVWDEERGGLASLEEVLADPALMTRENPSPMPLLPCGAVLYDDAVRFEPENKEYQRECAPNDLDWVSRIIPGKHEPMNWKDETSLAIALRPGETYIREWDHEEGMYFLFRTEDKYGPPHHFCGIEAERRDTVNWPFWEPYIKEITSTDPQSGQPRTVRTGRYWANGRLSWKPATALKGFLGDFRTAENVVVGDASEGWIVAADAGRPAVLEWEVKLPYMLQGGWLAARTRGGVAVSVDADKRGGGDAFVSVEMTQGAQGIARGELRPRFVENMGTRRYRLRIELTGEGAGIRIEELVTIFQHNMYALPQLLPGRNRVRVAVGEGSDLTRTPLKLSYEWEEGGVLRRARHEIRSNPFEFEIEIPSEAIPRMRRLVLSNEKVAD